MPQVTVHNSDPNMLALDGRILTTTGEEGGGGNASSAGCHEDLNSAVNDTVDETVSFWGSIPVRQVTTEGRCDNDGSPSSEDANSSDNHNSDIGRDARDFQGGGGRGSTRTMTTTARSMVVSDGMTRTTLNSSSSSNDNSARNLSEEGDGAVSAMTDNFETESEDNSNRKHHQLQKGERDRVDPERCSKNRDPTTFAAFAAAAAAHRQGVDGRKRKNRYGSVDTSSGSSDEERERNHQHHLNSSKILKEMANHDGDKDAGSRGRTSMEGLIISPTGGGANPCLADDEDVTSSGEDVSSNGVAGGGGEEEEEDGEYGSTEEDGTADDEDGEGDSEMTTEDSDDARNDYRAQRQLLEREEDLAAENEKLRAEREQLLFALSVIKKMNGEKEKKQEQEQEQEQQVQHTTRQAEDLQQLQR